MNHARKGKTFEQDIARQFRKAGFPAERFRLSGQGLNLPDVRVTIRGGERTIECKKRAAGWAELYRWTDSADMAVVCADRKAPLVILPLHKFLEML